MATKRRGANEGTIFQERPGKWRAIVSVGHRNGRRIRKTFTAGTRREVREKLTKALRDHQLGINVAPQRQTVSQFLQSWLMEVAKQNVRSSTFASYEWIVREHLIPGIGPTPIAKLSAQQLQSFLNDRLTVVKCPQCKRQMSPAQFPDHLRKTHADKAERMKTPKPLAPRTVQHIHATLRVALAQAEKWGIVPRNVASLVDAPHVPHKQMRLLTPEQAQRFLKSIMEDRLEALYSVAMALGLRQGEALGLRWADIDLDRGTLTVANTLQRIDSKLQLVETKRDRSRHTITLPQICVKALWRHRVRQDEERRNAEELWQETGFVFTTTCGTPLDGPTVTHRFQKALRTAQLPHMRFHDLRHTCATLLLAQGVHPRLVMDILGHSQIAVTMNTYSHVIPTMQKEIAMRMDEILNPLATPLATSAKTENLNQAVSH
jgi:integrase